MAQERCIGHHSIRLSLFAGLLLATLVGCQAPTPPSPPKALSVEGLWLVTPAPGTEFGSGGTTTLEFGSASSGAATYLSQSTANGLTTCTEPVYALVSTNVLVLDGKYYTYVADGADKLELKAGAEEITLERVTGAPPVAACDPASTTLLTTLDEEVSYWSNLNAVGTVLYLNLDTAGDPIIGFDSASDTIGAPRTYTTSVSGGAQRFVVAARSNDLFYGQRACGGSTTIDYFNLATNTSVTHKETGTDLGNQLSVRFGYAAGADLFIGGPDYSGTNTNLLLKLNPDTLDLLSSRSFMSGLPDEGPRVEDVTARGGDLLALVGDSIVIVGPTGRAERTYKLHGIGSTAPTGLTTVGSNVYLLTLTAEGKGIIYQVNLP